MAKRKLRHQSQFHRSQVGRAQRFIRLHLDEPLTLGKIAREAGASSYHFVRLFQAYAAETPFEFLRRIRLATSLRMLQEDPDGAITEIATSVGYETPSAFNKAFTKLLAMSPREFRNLGKDAQYELIYLLSKPKVAKEIKMNLTSKYEIVSRQPALYVFLERRGSPSEIAPGTWDALFPLAYSQVDPQTFVEFLGLSGMDRSRPGEDSMIYQAGMTLSAAPSASIKGLQHKKIEGGKYARFLLTGPYSHIWPAFDHVFKQLADEKIKLREDFCIENYLNDPKETPEDQLLTEILVPTL